MPEWVLALDAMGVIFKSGDDVGELLVPFILSKGGTSIVQDIEAAYMEGSLGRISAAEFWAMVGLPATVEDEYLSRHSLGDGLFPFLSDVGGMFSKICCISNDVSEWSMKLRRRFEVDTLIDPWIISGDVGVRKPDRKIYQALVSALGRPANQIVFVDDRERNVAAALSEGLCAILFGRNTNNTAPYRCVASFDELLRLCSRLTAEGPASRIAK